MHHKRKRPKDRRAGCLMCKPWKSVCVKKRKFMRGAGSVMGMADLSGPWGQEARACAREREQRDEAGVR